MNWKQTLDFVMTSRNREALIQLREKLERGEEIHQSLIPLLPHCLRADYEVLGQLMSVHKALQLSCEMAEQRKKEREQTMKVILYPAAMMLVSLAGLGMFNHFCFPMMISLAESFRQDVTVYQGVHILIRLFLILAVFCILILMILLHLAKKQLYRLSAYLMMVKKGRGEWIRRIRSLDFARYFLCCMEQGCSTRSTLNLMQKIRNKPFLKLLSWHVEQGLLQGESLESAMRDEVIDPALMSLIRCMSLSEDPVPLLRSYIHLRQKQITQKITHLAYLIQTSAYLIIALMVILVYRILLMPLSLIAGM